MGTLQSAVVIRLASWAFRWWMSKCMEYGLSTEDVKLSAKGLIELLEKEVD